MMCPAISLEDSCITVKSSDIYSNWCRSKGRLIFSHYHRKGFASFIGQLHIQRKCTVLLRVISVMGYSLVIVYFSLTNIKLGPLLWHFPVTLMGNVNFTNSFMGLHASIIATHPAQQCFWHQLTQSLNLHLTLQRVQPFILLTLCVTVEGEQCMGRMQG